MPQRFDDDLVPSDVAAAPSVSVIICTRDRASRLAPTLQALACLDLTGTGEFEIVFVNNASIDETQAVLTAFAASVPFLVRVLSEPHPGMSYARNTGVTQAKGALILFTDDDCIVAPDWVRTAIALFADGLDRVIGGRVELYDSAHLPIATVTKPYRQVAVYPVEAPGMMIGANFAFGRVVFDRVGPFDVRFGPGSSYCGGDEYDFIYRAAVQGFAAIYDPRLLVQHNHGRTVHRDGVRQLRGYCQGCGAVALKWLFQGRTDLMKGYYWSVVSKIKKSREMSTWQLDLNDEVWGVLGMFHFLLLRSWKPSK